MADEKFESTQFETFLDLIREFGENASEALQLYFDQESDGESELVSIYLDTFKQVLVNIGTEVKTYFDQADTETQNVIESHVRNTNSNVLLKSTNNLLAKKSKILGIIEKILPILEIIKKVIYQILELFPGFISKFLKKILTPLLEILDNIGKRILDLFSLKSASFYLTNAEQDFLKTHPQWRSLQFESY